VEGRSLKQPLGDRTTQPPGKGGGKGIFPLEETPRRAPPRKHKARKERTPRYFAFPLIEAFDAQ